MIITAKNIEVIMDKHDIWVKKQVDGAFDKAAAGEAKFHSSIEAKKMIEQKKQDIRSKK